MLDGFVNAGNLLAQGAELNLRPYRNILSPFSELRDMIINEDANIYADSYYGWCFDSWALQANAIYGKTDELPEYSGDSLANYGFLRVPYRRIPRILVHDQYELATILNSIRSADSDINKLLFRGQNREYYLPRSSSTLEALYGSAKALEPSLPTSASRRGNLLEEVIPEWCTLIQLFFGEFSQQVSQIYGKQMGEFIREEQRIVTSNYQFSLFALALAQHYGLPSSGLDVSRNAKVALFFAFNEFRVSSADPRIHLCRRIKKSSTPPVLYVITPRERFQINYFDFKPDGFPSVRPDKQAAHFIHTGWGLAKNDCARNIFLALYLDPEGNFGDVPVADQLFPTPETDPFGQFLSRKRKEDLPPRLKEFIGNFGWVEQVDKFPGE